MPKKPRGRGGSGRRDWRGISLVLLASAAFIAAFFAVAFSRFDSAVKTALCLADLILAGLAFHRLTGIESYYGILLIRSEAGFGAMRFVAKRFAGVCSWLADFGLALGFGLPFAWFARRRQQRSKTGFAWQALAAAAFFAFFFLYSPTAQQASAASAFFIALTLASGLFGFAFYFIAEHAWLVLTVAQTPPGVMPVVPGVTIPIEAIVAVAVIAVVHELAHGVICETVKLRLQSSGVMLLGWLPIGAFVEPDEKAFARLRLRDKRRILIAGSTSNALFFVVFFFLALACAALLGAVVAGASVQSSFYPALLPQGALVREVNGVQAKTGADANSTILQSALDGSLVQVGLEDGSRVLVPPSALVVREVKAGFPAQGILAAGDVVYALDGERVWTAGELKKKLSAKKPGEPVEFETSSGAKRVVLGGSAASGAGNAAGSGGSAGGEGGGVVGAVFAQEQSFYASPLPAAGFEWAYALLSLLLVILSYAFALNFVFAAVNLLPLFITDGHRIFYEEFAAALGKRKGALAATVAGAVSVALLIVNALPWLWL